MSSIVKLSQGDRCAISALSKNLCNVKLALEGSVSKMGRIEGSSDYSRSFTYDLVGTENVLTITHTGTTTVGVETIVETFTYVNPAVNGSNVTNIQYS